LEENRAVLKAERELRVATVAIRLQARIRGRIARRKQALQASSLKAANTDAEAASACPIAAPKQGACAAAAAAPAPAAAPAAVAADEKTEVRVQTLDDEGTRE
jgi:hypothetical protein